MSNETTKADAEKQLEAYEAIAKTLREKMAEAQENVQAAEARVTAAETALEDCRAS